MSQSDLFGAVPEASTPAKCSPQELPGGPPRLLRPDRHQIRFTPTDLESLLPPDHPARAIWAVVEKMDLSKFEATIAARETVLIERILSGETDPFSVIDDWNIRSSADRR